MSNIDDILFAPIGATTSAELVVPLAWLKVVEAIRTCRKPWKYSTVAGGALRDLDLKRKIKDVDIFINYDEDAGVYLLNALTPLNITQILMVEPDATGNSKACAAPHYLFHYDGWEFEISQRFEPITSYQQILGTFDLGICMICLDGDKVYRSPLYERDVSDQTITILQHTGGNTHIHAERIASKYPDWPIVDLNWSGAPTGAMSSSKP